MLPPHLLLLTIFRDGNHRNKTGADLSHDFGAFPQCKSPVGELDGLRMKWCCGCAYKQHRGCSFDVFKTAMNAQILHLANDHQDCNRWCTHKKGDKIPEENMRALDPNSERCKIIWTDHNRCHCNDCLLRQMCHPFNAN